MKHENTVDDFDEVSYFDDDINDTNQPINFDIFESGDTFESSISYFTDEVLRREIVENEFISNNEITSQIKLNENKKWNVSFLNREQKSYRVADPLNILAARKSITLNDGGSVSKLVDCNYKENQYTPSSNLTYDVSIKHTFIGFNYTKEYANSKGQSFGGVYEIEFADVIASANTAASNGNAIALNIANSAAAADLAAGGIVADDAAAAAAVAAFDANAAVAVAANANALIPPELNVLTGESWATRAGYATGGNPVHERRRTIKSVTVIDGGYGNDVGDLIVFRDLKRSVPDPEDPNVAQQAPFRYAINFVERQDCFTVRVGSIGKKMNAENSELVRSLGTVNNGISSFKWKPIVD